MDLNRLRIAVVGVGALGTQVLKRIIRMQPGKISIFDGDTVVEKNLKNQVLYTSADVGSLKADAAKNWVLRNVPDEKCESYTFYLGYSTALKYLKDSDIVLDFTDSMDSRAYINRACYALKRPLLIASIRGTEAFFYVINRRGACFNCILRSTTPFGGSCSTVPLDTASKAADLIIDGLSKFLKHLDSQQPFVSLSLDSGKTASIKLKRDKNCEVCNGKSATYGGGFFVSICGDGIKYSLQHGIDLSKIRLPDGFKTRRGDTFVRFIKDEKSILVSKFGDILFSGFSKGEAESFISSLSQTKRT